MTSDQRIHAFSQLGDYLRQPSEALEQVIHQAASRNSWFTPASIRLSFESLAKNLQESALRKWISPYLPALHRGSDKTVGLVLAGNIPLVGFHDILSALIAGFKVQIKLSSDDQVLIPFLLQKLLELEPAFETYISFTDRLNAFDLIIATGSNNTSRYFEYYFGKVPHIIRKNRNGIAIVHGDESQEELSALGHDLFDYFGLGCRNVSKIYFPEDYPIDLFFQAIEPFGSVINHHKYHNNYDYNKSIYLVNGNSHFDNGFLLLKEDIRLASPLAVAYYERYQRLPELLSILTDRQQEIQCTVSHQSLVTPIPIFPLGASQQPALDDYADGINTLDFLAKHRS